MMMQMVVVVIAIMMEVLVGMVFKGNGVLMVKIMMRLIMVVSKLKLLQVIFLNVIEVPKWKLEWE